MPLPRAAVSFLLLEAAEDLEVVVAHRALEAEEVVVAEVAALSLVSSQTWCARILGVSAVGL